MSSACVWHYTSLWQSSAHHRDAPVRAARDPWTTTHGVGPGTARTWQHRQDHVKEETPRTDHVQVRRQQRRQRHCCHWSRPLHHPEGRRSNESYKTTDHEGARSTRHVNICVSVRSYCHCLVLAAEVYVLWLRRCCHIMHQHTMTKTCVMFPKTWIISYMCVQGNCKGVS